MTREIEATVEYWAQFLRGPAPLDNGDKEGKSMIFGMLAQSTQERASLEQVIKFKTSLAKLLKERITPHWHKRDPQRGSMRRQIYCDYHSDPILMQACADAQYKCSDMTTFPWKTYTETSPGVVYLKQGYGAERTVLYTEEKQ